MMKKSKQLSLFKPSVRFFGGSLLHGKRRGRRPLSSREPIHLVMRSSWASGPTSFLLAKNRKEIERLSRLNAKIAGVKIYRRAIVGNHLHLIIKIPHRPGYRKFIRSLSGQIASHVMVSQSFKIFREQVHLARKRGDAPQSTPDELEIKGKGQAFWQFRPWTRVLFWGRDFKFACVYVEKNILEALGFNCEPHRPRKKPPH